MTLRWPEKVLRPQGVAFDVAARSLTGGATIEGAAQVVSSAAGLWTATFERVSIRSRNQVLCARALSALLEGRTTPILVPTCRGYQPVPAGAVTDGLYDAVPHSDETFFSDGSGYVGGVIDVQLSSTIVAGATTGQIAVNYAGAIEPGQHFSIGERLYRVKSIEFSDATAATIKFWPPLREAASIGTRLEFDDPVCRMRLASDREFDLLLDGRRFGNPTVNFVEDL